MSLQAERDVKTYSFAISNLPYLLEKTYLVGVDLEVHGIELVNKPSWWYLCGVCRKPKRTKVGVIRGKYGISVTWKESSLHEVVEWLQQHQE